MKSKAVSVLFFTIKSVLLLIAAAVIGTALLGALHGFYDGIMGNPPRS